jgi:hypothetical protein
MIGRPEILPARNSETTVYFWIVVSCERQNLGIPVKPNTKSGMNPNGIPG